MCVNCRRALAKKDKLRFDYDSMRHSERRRQGERERHWRSQASSISATHNKLLTIPTDGAEWTLRAQRARVAKEFQCNVLETQYEKFAWFKCRFNWVLSGPRGGGRSKGCAGAWRGFRVWFSVVCWLNPPLACNANKRLTTLKWNLPPAERGKGRARGRLSWACRMPYTRRSWSRA